MRILIVGAGYSGGAAAREWAASGHTITAVTSNPDDAAAITDVAEVVVCRGSDPRVADLVPGQDAIVIGVAPVYGDPEDVWRDTYLATADRVTGAIGGSPAVVAWSSTNGYGSAGGASICTEDTPATPTKPGEAIQVDADNRYLALNDRGIPAAVLRVGHIYGPGPRAIGPSVQRMPGRVVPYPADSAASLIHRDDVVGATMHVIQHRLTGIYNLVDDTAGSRSSFYDGLARAAGLEPAAWGPPGGLPTAFPNAKIKATGYRFRVPTFTE